MTLVAAVLGTVAAAGMMGCGKGQTKGAGAASVSASALSLDPSQVSTVTLTVVGSAEKVNLTVPLAKANAQYTALVSNLPVGSDYVFTATAYDNSTPPNTLYQGSASPVSIGQGGTASVVIDMSQTAPATPGLTLSAPVIDSISASETMAGPGDLVNIAATAHDPMAGYTQYLTFAWSSTCGASTLGTASTTAGSDDGKNPPVVFVDSSSKVVFTAPSSGTSCTINLTVTDPKTGLTNVASMTITLNAGVGNANITANVDTFPVISGISATPVPLVPSTPTTLVTTATDADGDALNYTWTVTAPCTGTFADAAPAKARPFSTATFTLTSSYSTAPSCNLQVVVDDGNWADTGKPKGGVITNSLTLPVVGPANQAASPPSFGYAYQSKSVISGGDTVNLAIVVNCPGTGGTVIEPLTWTSSDATALTATTPAALGLGTSPFDPSAVVYLAPTQAADDGDTITVTAGCSNTTLTATKTFVLTGSGQFCATAGAGADCTQSLNNPCVSKATCQADGSCKPITSVTCAPSGNVCKLNVCDSQVGSSTAGTCILAWTGVNDTTNTPCNDNNVCTGANNTDMCSNGVCTGAPVTCAQPSNTCQQATCDPTLGCQTSNKSDGTACDDGNACTGTVTTAWNSATPTVPGVSADSCLSGVCFGAPVSCPTLDICQASSTNDNQFTCPLKVCMGPSYAQSFVPPFAGIAINPAGTPWTTGSIYNPFNFGAGSVTSTGSADVFLNKLDPATGLATASFTFGYVGGADQNGNGVAVASSGNVAVMGSYLTEIDFDAAGGNGTDGLDYLSKASVVSGAAMNYFVVIDGTSSGQYATPIKAHNVDVGTGALMAVASNPSQNAFAICGKTSRLLDASTTKTGLLTGTGGAYGGGMDIVVAKIDASGNIIWGKQFGGNADQVCESVAMDSAGNVIIGGNYTGTLSFSATVNLPVVADTTVGLIYVAKLASADGTPISAATWGTTGRSDVYGVAVDGSNNIVIAGSLGANVTFGTFAVSDLGLTDAYVVKLNSSLVPQWAESFGDANYDQAAKAVGVSSTGNVFIGGAYEGSLGALGLTASSNTALDAFTAELSGADGSLLCAHTYGDAAGTQQVTGITVASAATGSAQDNVMIGGTYSSTITLGGSTLNTGSPSLAWSFLAKLIP
jgi:hypothetical protein